jgi:hypothetical protein
MTSCCAQQAVCVRSKLARTGVKHETVVAGAWSLMPAGTGTYVDGERASAETVDTKILKSSQSEKLSM